MIDSLLACDQICFNCGEQLRMWEDTCTRCGARLHGQPALRKWGVAYLMLGTGLCGVISYIAWIVAQIMIHSNDPGATTRYSGTPLQGVMIFGVFGMVFLVGVTLLAAGVFQVAYGRKSKKVTKVALFWYGLIWVAYGLLTVGGWIGWLND